MSQPPKLLRLTNVVLQLLTLIIVPLVVRILPDRHAILLPVLIVRLSLHKVLENQRSTRRNPHKVPLVVQRNRPDPPLLLVLRIVASDGRRQLVRVRLRRDRGQFQPQRGTVLPRSKERLFIVDQQVLFLRITNVLLEGDVDRRDGHRRIGQQPDCGQHQRCLREEHFYETELWTGVTVLYTS